MERGADLHTAQLMPLPLTVSCFSKIQIGFTFLVPAHPGSPGQRTVIWVRVSLCFAHEMNNFYSTCYETEPLEINGAGFLQAECPSRRQYQSSSLA